MSGQGARILAVNALDLAYETGPWEFALNRADEIAAHWAKRKAENPALFDGRVLLLARHELAGDEQGGTILRGAYRAVDYRAFLAWRDFEFPGEAFCNCFSMAALRTSDGAFLLGEMAGHTANAGAIYFAAGTPDAQDIVGARVDLSASVMREMAEETGLGADEVVCAAGWRVVYAPPHIACMKLMRIDAPAAAVKARIEAFLAREARAELARLHVVRSADAIDAARSPPFVVDFLRDAFAQSPVG